MNIFIISLLTISLLIIAPGCKKNNVHKQPETTATTEIVQETVSVSSDDISTSKNIKC